MSQFAGLLRLHEGQGISPGGAGSWDITDKAWRHWHWFALIAGCSQQAQTQDPGQWQAQGPQSAAGFPQTGMPGMSMDQAQPSAMPPALDTSTMQPAQIIDSNGFGQPMVAADLQIPAGWQTVGGVTWNDGTNCIGNQMQVSWSAIAPDSLTAVEILPGFNWQVAGTEMQMNPCPAAPYRSTREFLEATVQRTRPGARMLDYQDQPEIAQQVEQAARAAQANGQQRMQGQARTDAGRLLIAYTKDGVEMREVLSAVVSFTELQGNVVGGTTTISSIRGPNNRLDMELGKRIGASMRVNPQWLEARNQRSMASLQRSSNAQRSSINDWHNRQMSIINARGAADRAAIRMRTIRKLPASTTRSPPIPARPATACTSRPCPASTRSITMPALMAARCSPASMAATRCSRTLRIRATPTVPTRLIPSPPSGYVELEREQ